MFPRVSLVSCSHRKIGPIIFKINSQIRFLTSLGLLPGAVLLCLFSIGFVLSNESFESSDLKWNPRYNFFTIDSVRNVANGKHSLDTTAKLNGDTLHTSNVIMSKDSLANNKNDSLKLFQVPVDSLLSFGDTSAKKTDSLKPVSFNKDTSHLKIDSLTAKKDTSHYKIDSLTAKRDTVKIDSLKIDSTARKQFFKYIHKDFPTSSVFTKRPSKFFANSTRRTKTLTIDSTGKYMILREKIGEQLIKPELKIPINDYIAMKMKSRENEMWDALALKYEAKAGKKDLSNIIKDITDFEIPLPSVGVLSIFGAPKISLRIGGSVDIHGAWRNETTEGITASSLGNTRNEPDFRQQVQVNVNGTIGDKLQISADWNTERTFEYENQLKIKYTGFEDEIVQSVEAGNVSLSTSGLVGGSEALFGIKANFKMGPLTLTAIASQKKGEVKEKSVSGGSQATESTIHAYDYSKNHFFLDKVYADTTEIAGSELNLFYKYFGNPTPVITMQYRVKDIEVWKTVYQTVSDKSLERNGIAYINLPERTEAGKYPESLRDSSGRPGAVVKGRFVRLMQGQDYILHPETGFITFKTNLQDQDAIAVSYRRENLMVGAEDDLFYGEFLSSTQADTAKRIILKLVKPPNLQPENTEAWNLMLKNIYPLGPRDIKKEGFQLDIKYAVQGSDPQSILNNVKLLSAFGFDLVDVSGNAQPDGIFDFKPGVTILPETGEIIFPRLQPFGRNLPLADTSLCYNDVYDLSTTFAKQNTMKDKFLIVSKSTGSSQSTYQLGFNIVENSVKVSLNGRDLTNGVDYTVDYNIGTVTIRNESALAPGANLKISYEENDLFQIASKTLFGLRGMIDISQNTKLGFSMLTLSQQTLSDKVRIGEEPLSNSIYGLDFTTSRDLPFLTNAIDKVISTKEMSNFKLTGEVAMMSPNPNTKTSTITSDNGNNVAYIDDFEGAKRIIPIGISYTSWKDISIPDLLDPLIESLPGLSKMDYKGKSWWFNVLPSNVNYKSIWPLKKVATGDEAVTVLDFVFQPDAAGAYNYGVDGVNHPITEPEKSWGGMMKMLSSTANNLDEENIEFIEFWMQLQDVVPKGAKVNIDLGRISEDVIPNGRLDTEDKNLNELIDQGEDIGLDGLNDGQERDQYGSANSDPSNDNFSFSRTGTYVADDYMHINGTEGNAALTDVGRFPDTEDLNHNGTLDDANSYYRYEIPLDTAVSVNPFIAGGGGSADKWYLVRVPLKSFKTKVGDPSFTVVDMVRVFVTGVSSRTHFRMAEFNLVGNQWQKNDTTKSIMSISVVSVEDNPEYFSPGGVQREKDNTRPDQNILKNEQSLNLRFNKLAVNDSRQAIKYLYQPLYLFNYSEMKLYIHTPESYETSSIAYFKDTSEYNSDVSFRFGTDTLNYYEYRQPLQPDPSQRNWSEIDIKFSELTALKQIRDSVNMDYKVSVPGKPGHYYVVRGNPTLTAIKFLSFGIKHRQNSNLALNEPVSGDIWVDELRVIGADNTKGIAYTASASLKLADVISLNVNVSHTDPYFHRLSDRFGSKMDQMAWGFSADVDVLKIIPLGGQDNNLKVNYSRSESIGKPLYLAGTDIKVSEAKKLAMDKLLKDTNLTRQEAVNLANHIETDAQNLNVSETWTVANIKLKLPSNYWLIRDTWNSLSFGFNYNKTFSRNATVLDSRSWLWNANMNYTLNISPDYSFYPAGLPYIGGLFGYFNDYRTARVYYLPQSISYNITAKRSRSFNTNRTIGTSIANEIIARDFATTRGLSSNWKMTENGFFNVSTTYSFDAASSLSYLETDAFSQQRPESRIWRDIFTSAFFGKDFQYSQSIDIKTSPRLPNIWDLGKYLTLTAGYNVRYQWSNDVRQEELGRSVGYNNRTSLGLTLRWKSLLDPLFQDDPNAAQQPNTPQQQVPERGRDFGEVKGRQNGLPRPGEWQNPLTEQSQTPAAGQVQGMQNPSATVGTQPVRPVIDSNFVKKDSVSYKSDSLVLKKDSLAAKKDSIQVKPKSPIYKQGLLALKILGRILIADYESIAINFSNDNTLGSSGIRGTGNGLKNFWGIKYNSEEGPSRLYMIGLSSDVGLRAKKANLTDNFSQRNSIDLRTSKPLWEGAKIDFTWKLGWSVSKSTSLLSDSLGHVTVTNVTSTGSINRSFLTLPPVFFLSFLKSGVKRVHEIYAQGTQDQAALSNAFLQGFETLPLLGKIGFMKNFTNFIPRPNWRITWDGLEKLILFRSFTKRVSIDHSYTSEYTEGWKIDQTGNQVVQSQKITMGFQPLVGLNMTFNDLWSGNMTGNIKYSTRSGYDLGATTKNITEDFSKEIGISFNYSKSGFEIPLFGISLKNDIEFSFSYSTAKSSNILYDLAQFNENGTPQNGTTRISLEPRIKYVISSRVTLSVFYKRSKTTPEGAARVPPTTTNEAGLDVRISIQ